MFLLDPRRKIWNWILIEIVRSKFGRDFETETWSGFWNQTLIKIGLRSLEFLMYDLINRSYFGETFGLLCLVKELEDSIYFLLSVKERSNIKEPGLTSMQKVRFSPSIKHALIDSCFKIELWEVQFGACFFIPLLRMVTISYKWDALPSSWKKRYSPRCIQHNWKLKWNLVIKKTRVYALMRGLLDTQPSIQVCAKINEVLHLSMACIYSFKAIQIHRFHLKNAEMMDGKIFHHVFSCIFLSWRYYSFSKYKS